MRAGGTGRLCSGTWEARQDREAARAAVTRSSTARVRAASPVAQLAASGGLTSTAGSTTLL